MFPPNPRGRRPVSVLTNRLALEALESRLNPSSAVATDQVTNLYHYALGRDPEPTGLSTWSAAVESGPASLIRVVDGIFHSEESIQYLVTQDFTRYLGRLPEPGGLEHFVLVMDGGRNANLVTASILGSREFADKSAQDNTAFVDRLYTQLLGRVGDTEGLAAHLAALDRGVTRTHVALSFLNSPEYLSLQVHDAYQGLLGRSGSTDEVLGWVGVAMQSSEGLLGVKVRIAGSLEGANWLKDPISPVSSPDIPNPVFKLTNETPYDIVFTDSPGQPGHIEQPWEGFVLKPGESYDYANFLNYSIDIRPVPGIAAASVGTASVESRIGSDGGPYLYDTNGLLSFVDNRDDSTHLAHAPFIISSEVIRMTNSAGAGAIDPSKLNSWGWTNTSPYDLKITGVTGPAATSPPVGTIIPTGTKLSGIQGLNFEFDILAPGKTDILGHSVVATGTSGGNNYLYDTKNLAVFNYNEKDSKASGWNPVWQDVTLNLAPPVISNNGWSSGMGNTDSVPKPGESFWALDYGSENGRWTIKDGAAYQSNQPIDYPGGKNYGSRAYPVTLDNSYKASYGPGAGMDGLWQMDIKIGSSGSSDNSFCETFYLAERVDPTVGISHYADGSPDGGPAGWSREIDIMETRWNAGGTKVGPQINLPTGEGNKGPFTGWTTDKKYYNTVLGEWADIGAPNEKFATFGILIRGNSLWIYAYKPDGTFWYSTDEIVKNSAWDQKGEFVPYIGTWGTLGNATINDRFTTGYQNFVYLQANDAKIAGLNPRDNPAAFGQALVHA